MDKDEHLLVILAHMLHCFGVANVIHGLELFNGFLFCDTNELLSQRTRPI